MASMASMQPGEGDAVVVVGEGASWPVGLLKYFSVAARGSALRGWSVSMLVFRQFFAHCCHARLRLYEFFLLKKYICTIAAKNFQAMAAAREAAGHRSRRRQKDGRGRS